MRINDINKTNFQAKNPFVRKADTLVRKVNKEIPTISVNKYAHFYNSPNFVYKDFFIKLDDKFYYEVRGPLESIMDTSNAFDYLNTAIKYLKNSPLANCNELVDITQIIFAMNGIKTFKAVLEPNIDHICLLAHIEQTKTIKDLSLECVRKDARELHDIIVIDPWLNFVDYAPNASYKFQNDYLKFIEDPIARELGESFNISKVVPEIYFSPYIESSLFVTPELKKVLVKTFPNLVWYK